MKRPRRAEGVPPEAQPAEQTRSPEGPNGSFPSWEDHGGVTTVRMLSGQSLLLTGQAVLKMVSGCLDIDGFLLTPSHPPLPVSTGPANSLALTLSARAEHATQVPQLDQQPVVTFTIARPAAHAVEPASSSRGAAEQARRSAAPSCELHPTSPNPPRALTVPADWSAALDAVLIASSASVADPTSTPPSTVAVVGPKMAGKSSLARLLVNRLLADHPVVAFLETDCGQCEITPPGVVSVTLLTTPLLGPPCTHLQPTTHAHYIGDLSPESDPVHYIAAVASLYRWYCSDACRTAAAAASRAADASHGVGEIPVPGWPPLVVNTHGWVKGVGLELLCEVLGRITPSHTIQVRSHDEKRNCPPGAFWWPADAGPCPTHVIHVSSPAARQAAVSPGYPAEDVQDGGDGSSPAAVMAPGKGGKPPPTAVGVRTFQWHAWAKAACGISPTSGTYASADLYNTAIQLCRTPPYIVRLEDIRLEFMHCEPPPEHLIPVAVNAVIVGLATAPPPDEAGPAALPVCHGVGLVRAVEPSRGELYVLTPLPEAVLQQVDTLLVGRAAAELPSSLLYPGALSAASPYLSMFALSGSSGAALGAGSSKPRRNLARSRLLAASG